MKKINKTIPTFDGNIPVECFIPDHKGPLLVVVPSIFGVSPDVTTFSEHFAQRGALVYVIDSFWRHSPGPLPIPAGAHEAMKRMRQAH